ncbi:hypothetical protein PG993_014821 [Apiospora rasikravindrae]|uniref:Uncharacterized protein n=1 Tax=Apiospora rasikravindrae TaxID=990691 RepID=A0ABR1RP57_9PEZI
MGLLQLIVPLLLLTPYAISERLPDCDHDKTSIHKQRSSGVSICSIAQAVVTNNNLDQIQDDGDRKKTFVNKTVDQLLAAYKPYNALVYSDEASGGNTKNSVFQHRNGGHAEGKDFTLPLSEEGRTYRYHVWVFAAGTFSPGGDHRVAGGRGEGEEWGYGGCVEQNSRGGDVEFCNRAAQQQQPQSSSGTRTGARTTASSSETEQPSTAVMQQSTDETATVVSTTLDSPSATTTKLDPTTAIVQTPGSTTSVSGAMARPSVAAAVACVFGLLVLCL